MIAELDSTLSISITRYRTRPLSSDRSKIFTLHNLKKIISHLQQSITPTQSLFETILTSSMMRQQQSIGHASTKMISASTRKLSRYTSNILLLCFILRNTSHTFVETGTDFTLGNEVFRTRGVAISRKSSVKLKFSFTIARGRRQVKTARNLVPVAESGARSGEKKRVLPPALLLLAVEPNVERNVYRKELVQVLQKIWNRIGRQAIVHYFTSLLREC